MRVGRCIRYSVVRFAQRIRRLEETYAKYVVIRQHPKSGEELNIFVANGSDFSITGGGHERPFEELEEKRCLPREGTFLE